jgi:hypothetical protein
MSGERHRVFRSRDANFDPISKNIFLMCLTCAGALAATKQHSTALHHDVYDVRGVYVGSDPDAGIRFELRRDQSVRE